MIDKTSGEGIVGITRRDLGMLLSVAAAARAAAGESLPSKTFRFEDLPVRPDGKKFSRAMLKGETSKGVRLELHETELPAGEISHPAHRHENDEFILIREGTVEMTINGQKSTLGPGSAIYISSNDEHALRNVGKTAAQYFALAIG